MEQQDKQPTALSPLEKDWQDAQQVIRTFYPAKYFPEMADSVIEQMNNIYSSDFMRQLFPKALDLASKIVEMRKRHPNIPITSANIRAYCNVGKRTLIKPSL